MKFSVEVDIDWIDEDSTIDGEVNDRLIRGLANSIEEKLSHQVSEKIAATAERLIQAKTELLINTIMEQPVVVSNGWKKTKEYPSIYDMVEDRMSALYQGKILASDTCEKDPLLKDIEDYVDRQVNSLLSDVNKRVELHSKNEANKAVREHEFIKNIESVINIEGKES